MHVKSLRFLPCFSWDIMVFGRFATQYMVWGYNSLSEYVYFLLFFLSDFNRGVRSKLFIQYPTVSMVLDTHLRLNNNFNYI